MVVKYCECRSRVCCCPRFCWLEKVETFQKGDALATYTAFRSCKLAGSKQWTKLWAETLFGAMADLKLDNEFGSELAGAGSRPAFAHLVRFRPKDITQKEFPTTLTLT